MFCREHSTSVNNSMMQGVMYKDTIVSRNNISTRMNLIMLMMCWMFGVTKDIFVDIRIVFFMSFIF